MKTYEEIMKDYDEKVALAMREDTLPEVLSDLATAMFTYPDTRLVRALYWCVYFFVENITHIFNIKK